VTNLSHWLNAGQCDRIVTVFLEELTLQDSLKHAETTWYEKANWSKMTWAVGALKSSEIGMQFSGFGLSSGSYLSSKEFKLNHAVSFKRSLGSDIAERFGCLWLCYNNATHSGYRVQFYHNTSSTLLIGIFRVESGVESSLGLSGSITPTAGDEFALWKQGKKIEAYQRKEGTGAWNLLLSVKDTATPFTTGFIGADGQGSDPFFTNFMAAEQAEEAAPEVTNPGTQKKATGSKVSIQIVATRAVFYSASSLPPGLTINSSTGLISGTLTGTGAYTVQITAENNSGATTTISFTYTVAVALFEPAKSVSKVTVEKVKAANGQLVTAVLTLGTPFETADPQTIAVLENDFPGVVMKVE
jgi:hypothetical protein